MRSPGVAGALAAIVEHATAPHVLFLEEDFKVSGAGPPDAAGAAQERARKRRRGVVEHV